jgi:Epoxide hydrolase N terminus
LIGAEGWIAGAGMEWLRVPSVTEPGPFQIAVPGDVLDDLARRLAAARLPPRQSVPDGEPGDPAGEDDEVIERIAGLLAYWRDGYDWRDQERRMNAVPQRWAEVDGVACTSCMFRAPAPTRCRCYCATAGPAPWWSTCRCCPC